MDTAFVGQFRLVGGRTDKHGTRWRLLGLRAAAILPDHWVQVATTVLVGKVATARAWATAELHQHQVRVVAWHPTPGEKGRNFTAQTAGWWGQWQVTTYKGEKWHYRITCTGWQRADGVMFRDLDHIRRDDNVDLIPTEVSSVAALIAELSVWRAVAGSYTAPEACFDAACDDYDGDGNLLPAVPGPGCSHLEPVIAATGQVRALHRVDAALDELRREANTGAKVPPATEAYMAGIQHAYDTIRAAINAADKEDG